LNSVRYELSTLQEERELEKIRHEKDIRTLEAKVEEEGKRADVSSSCLVADLGNHVANMLQTGETDKRYLFDKQKELSTKLQKVKDQATNHKVS